MSTAVHSPTPERGDDLAQAQLQAIGQVGLNGLFSLVRALRLYDPNNAAVARIVDEFLEALQPWLARSEDGLRLTVMSDQIFANERLLRADPTLYERVRSLHERLEPLGINEVEFSRDLERPDLLAFVETLAAHTRGQGSRLQDTGTEAITATWVQGDAVAAYRLAPDRLAVWLYASLLDLTEQLYRRAKAGETPSLLPLRRALQLLVDHLPGNLGVFQLLAALRDPSPPPSRANLRVLVAIELIGFGHWLGLPPHELVPLGLAGILGGLARGRDEDRPVRALLRFQGLGELAMPVALVLHDAVTARTGRDAGMAGRALAMVEAWSMLVAGREGTPPRAPVAVDQALAAGQPPWVGRELGRAFAAFLGRWPLGSLLRLEDGRTAIVVDRPHDAQPVVLPVQSDGTAGERLDLSQGGPRITGHLEPAQAAVQLSRLVHEGVDQDEEADSIDPERARRQDQARQRQARRQAALDAAPLPAPQVDFDLLPQEADHLPDEHDGFGQHGAFFDDQGIDGEPVITPAILRQVGSGPQAAADGDPGADAVADRVEDMELAGLDEIYGTGGGLDEPAIDERERHKRRREVTGFALVDDQDERSEVYEFVMDLDGAEWVEDIEDADTEPA